MTARLRINATSRFRRTATLLCGALLALSACAGSSAADSVDSGADATTAPTVVAGEPVEDLVVDPPNDDPPADTGASTSSDGGSCTVESSGAVELSYTTGGGAATIASNHWFPVDSAGHGATPALVLNCDAGDGTLFALSIDSPDDLAFAPGSYDVPAPSTAVAVITPGQFWAPTGAVTLQLDSFDASGIRGSTAFDATDSAGATMAVTVTFDLDNPVPS
jgi:hypothetical protein